MALVESGLREFGWRRCMQSAREQYRPPDDRVEVSSELRGTAEDRWEYASRLSNERGPSLHAIREERERRKHPPPVSRTEPGRVTRELADVRTRSDPDSSVYAPRKHKSPANTPSRSQRLQDMAHKLTGKRQKP
jgi:hypothetical protein